MEFLKSPVPLLKREPGVTVGSGGTIKALALPASQGIYAGFAREVIALKTHQMNSSLSPREEEESRLNSLRLAEEAVVILQEGVLTGL